VGITGVRQKIGAVFQRCVEILDRRPELPNLVLRAWVEHEDEDVEPLPVPKSVIDFLTSLVNDASSQSELSSRHRTELMNVMRTMMWGISIITLTGADQVASTVEGLKRIIDGSLFIAT
ncbi:MAG: hypothetical protein JWM12_2641, partial [Ilumatobacteraceae bacterium]|nr:hypothetical protein [Ilumatobacteraceae bacterium]